MSPLSFLNPLTGLPPRRIRSGPRASNASTRHPRPWSWRRRGLETWALKGVISHLDECFVTRLVVECAYNALVCGGVVLRYSLFPFNVEWWCPFSLDWFQGKSAGKTNNKGKTYHPNDNPPISLGLAFRRKATLNGRSQSREVQKICRRSKVTGWVETGWVWDVLSLSRLSSPGMLIHVDTSPNDKPSQTVCFGGDIRILVIFGSVF